jgi:hypothetical protein
MMQPFKQGFDGMVVLVAVVVGAAVDVDVAVVVVGEVTVEVEVEKEVGVGVGVGVASIYNNSFHGFAKATDEAKIKLKRLTINIS